MQELNAKRSKFWDTIDNIDRYLYGRKMKNFLIGAIIVLIIAPLVDWCLEVPLDRLTWLSTLLFLVYTVIIILAWINSWRDDKGNWTFERAKSRLKTYYKSFRNTASTTRTNSKDENLYKIGFGAFFVGIGWKSLQNLSVFIRKPIQNITGHKMIRFIHFERFTLHWYWVLILIGLIILGFLWKSNPAILKRIKQDLIQLFGKSTINEYSGQINFKSENTENLVVDTKSENQIKTISTNSKSELFNSFLYALKTWEPGKCRTEYEYQDKLFLHLKNKMPDSLIETEFPIGDKVHGNKGRADIVIDKTILIEMKKDNSTSAVQRAQGQISQYSGIWLNRGPVILLLCNFEFEFAKLKFKPTMLDMIKLERSVLTIVAAD